VRWSCGELAGIAVIVAISPSWLGAAGVTAATSGVSRTAASIRFSCSLVDESPFGVSTASSSGPFDPGPNAPLSCSYAMRRVSSLAWLPSSG
jgi:hypothetical protein